MNKHGKRYTEIAKLVDEDKSYTPTEAVELAKQT